MSLRSKLYCNSKTPYLLHGVVKAVVVPAMYFPHDEVYFHVFDVAIAIVSERDSGQNNPLEPKRELESCNLPA